MEDQSRLPEKLMEQGASIFLQQRKPRLPQQPWPWILGGHVARSPGETHSEPAPQA